MPPKQMLTKEKIISTALNIAKHEGINAITARRLGMELGCSARPIFTVFSSMEEVHKETLKAAKELYKSYVETGMQNALLPFKGVGLQYVKFANDNPKLFQLLFMQENKSLPSLEKVLFQIDENSDKVLDVIQEQYNLNREESIKLYLHLWIYTHGIATLTATRVCSYDDETLNAMLGEVAVSILKNIKNLTKGD